MRRKEGQTGHSTTESTQYQLRATMCQLLPFAPGRNTMKQASPSPLAASSPGAVRKGDTTWWPKKDRKRKRRDSQLDGTPGVISVGKDCEPLTSLCYHFLPRALSKFLLMFLILF